MSFDEIRFPENIDYGFIGGPLYSTDIVELFSGYEQRNQNWAAARMKYTAAHAVRDPATITALIQFFRARQGRTTGFRFRDWSDYSATNQAIAVGDGTTTVFQLIKTYTSGPSMETRIITKPVASGSQVSTIPQIYLNSVLQVAGTAYTLDYTTGLFTFTAAPASGVPITADFEFDVPVRFDIDQAQIRQEYSQEYYWDSISLIEVRV